MTDFERDLAGLLNRHSRENQTNTPDFLLAEYLVSCLEAYERVTIARAKWWEPSSPEGTE